MALAAPLNHTVSITAFNRGKAGQIFSSVKESGMAVVMKNNEAECVLLSPKEYNALLERIEDMELAALAAERLKGFDLEADKTVSFEEICTKNQIGLKASGEVELA